MGPFWQHGHNLIKLGEGVYYLILNACTTFQMSCAKGLQTRRFLCVPYINLWKTSESGVELLLKASKYDQEIPQLHSADQPTAYIKHANPGGGGICDRMCII